MITLPERTAWARCPTPLERLDRVSRDLGVDFWIKRDDETGFLLSGNKVRKLEFVLARPRLAGATGVVTCGGSNSNHCRATTVLACRLGLDVQLFLRTADGRRPSDLQGNTLLNVAAGANIHWITPDDYAKREALMAAAAASARKAGGEVVVIPEGASNALGACGYVVAVREIIEQWPDGQLPDYIVHAMGSGGTTAGLLAGTVEAAAPWRIVGVPVCDDEAMFRARVALILRDMSEWGVDANVALQALDVVEGYQGHGYGLTTPQEMAVFKGVLRQEGLLLDPCYTGKAWCAMVGQIRCGQIPSGSRVLFLHTGGGLSNFSYGAEWGEE